MKIGFLVPLLFNLAFASAAIIDGGTLTPFAGPNVQPAANRSTTVTTLVDYDFVVVGSGAGGAPLAARLAQAGFSVLLLEAGTDQTDSRVYTTPLGHPLATELVPMKWDFWASPFGNPAEDARNEKLTYTLPDGTRYTGLSPPPGATPLGVLYPRAGTLGGCTAHNALISVTPHESDWRFLANITGDKSWAPAEMRKYFIKLEKNNYLPRGTPGHGSNGWFETSLADPAIATTEPKVDAIIKAAAYTVGNTVLGLTKWLLSDLNSASLLRDGAESLYRVPIAMTSDRKRSGPVDLLKATVNAKGKDGKPKYRLDIMLNTLVTKVRFDTKRGGSPRAIGVDFELGESLYGADPRRQVGRVGKGGLVTARREVIISAGTFNTPQLLKLSGIGPASELKKHGIPLLVDLPGVGTNLQDRYEAPVIVRSDTPIASNVKCTFSLDGNDPCWIDYENGKGLYASNGAPVAYTIKSSTAENGNADIFMAGFPGFAFTGYLPGWPFIAARSDSFTWLALKSHSRNTAGTVTLRSADPHDIPVIQLRNFAVGGEADLSAAIEGPNWARAALKNVARFDNVTKWTEVWPGPVVQTTKQMKDWAKYTTWGHHACCTAPIGKDGDKMAVLDSQFRVRGVTGLRVVDASSWAKIPGFYIVVPLYILSEKAADVIIAASS